MATTTQPHLVSLAPQFLVDDLQQSIAYYRDKLGFKVDFVYDDFYAGISRDGLVIHLKWAPKTVEDRAHRKNNEHLDASAGVEGVEALYEEFEANGATIIKPIGERPWGATDFYVEDPDGYIICFGGVGSQQKR